MINKTLYGIFQQGSRTYFYSSLFFPTNVRRDVFKLYGFVRKADNFVDSVPQNVNGFFQFKRKYEQALAGKTTNDVVIDSFVDLMQRKKFEEKWIDSFFQSMEMDIYKTTYQNLEETLEYIYGSAEIIGLMMAKTMNLTDNSLLHAKYLGRAMQYINFIRDIAEDLQYNRIYFPKEDLEKHKLKNLDYEHTKKNPAGFSNFIEEQLHRFCEWQENAEQGYQYIPKRYLISVKTAADMYKWTAYQIKKQPFIVYEWKVKPLISQIITKTLINVVNSIDVDSQQSPCPIKS